MISKGRILFTGRILHLWRRKIISKSRILKCIPTNSNEMHLNPTNSAPVHHTPQLEIYPIDSPSYQQSDAYALIKLILYQLDT